MLLSLTIRNVVLIERLQIDFGAGLCALTGETGGGKSILLDSLGLALGARADSGLVRQGADKAQVTAQFEVPDGHPARAILEECDLAAAEDEELVLRRSLGANGRGRAYVNDQPVSVSVLRRLGDALIEIQGQFAQRGLMDSGTHRGLLDAYGGLDPRVREVGELYRAWRDAVAAHERAQTELADARQDEEHLRHAIGEIDELAPQEGEEAELAQQRELMMNAERLMGALNQAESELAGGGTGRGAESALAAARRGLERGLDIAGDALDPAVEAIDRSLAEAEEALARIHSVAHRVELDSGEQERIEERYFALKELARKHGCEVDELPALRDQLAQRLATVEHGEAHVAELAEKAEAARTAYLDAARALSEARTAAGHALDAAVNAELPPLRLDKATFRTRVDAQDDPAQWGPSGLDRVAFEVATNPGSAPGPLGRIASGGELSRFLLALKVVLAQVAPERTLVFDEVDSGIGGATADAVGERLARLADGRQILVVTHSPQVAARAHNHWRIGKTEAGATVVTDVDELGPGERREEIARMLAGASITDEARAAADKLMGPAE
ncbi:DNA replication and repair protein RecN [Limimonas halophila]|uniref:DNA repair protein RecN n=1 Tax=Limimonas halophila TaxID=1082479 RepID=A0A1G7U630_9PROT|nr:DNA repair protein RecN [Limimonas halophila]SDG42509.1 DNA replication and repair protein RecN [Limimonas halophila]